MQGIDAFGQAAARASNGGAPSDTQRVRPWMLALGIVPRDDPREHLRCPRAVRALEDRHRCGLNAVTPCGAAVWHGDVGVALIETSGRGDHHTHWARVVVAGASAVRLRTPFRGVRADRHAAGFERRPPAGGVGRDRHGSGTRASYRDVLAACPSKRAAAGGRCENAVCPRRTRCGRRTGSRPTSASAGRHRIGLAWPSILRSSGGDHE
jgi:hypothetical protein